MCTQRQIVIATVFSVVLVSVGSAFVVLPSALDHDFATSWTSSALAQYFYHLARTNDSYTRPALKGRLSSRVLARLAPHNLVFAQLPSLLQEALLWDVGVVRDAHGYQLNVYTSCAATSATMADLALSVEEFDQLGACSRFGCVDSEANAVTSWRAGTCATAALVDAAHCAIDLSSSDTDSIEASAWAVGGATSSVVAVPQVWLHTSPTMTTPTRMPVIHVTTPTKGDDCPADASLEALVIPCATFSHGTDWCPPAPGRLVEAWLQAVAASIASTDGSVGALRSTASSSSTSANASGHSNKITSANNATDSSALHAPNDPQSLENDNRKSKVSSSSNTTTRITISLSCAAVGIVLLIAAIVWRKRRQSPAMPAAIRKQSTSSTDDHVPCLSTCASNSPMCYMIMSPDSSPVEQVDPLRLSRQMDVITALLQHTELLAKQISMDDIAFESLVAVNGVCEVWRASYKHLPIAVQRLVHRHRDEEDRVEAFVREIQLVATLSHVNVLCYIGFAWNEAEHLCLISEFHAKGDLRGFLWTAGANASWFPTKFQIATGVARALLYLHHEHCPTIVHGNLKSHHVLLADDFEPKLTGFSVSCHGSIDASSVSAIVHGSRKWAAPEVLLGEPCTEKADIYAFGVLLSELDQWETRENDLDAELSEKVHPNARPLSSHAEDAGPVFSHKCPVAIAMVGRACLHPNARLRPAAADIVMELT